MNQSSLHFLEQVVFLLAVFTLGLAGAIFSLMHFSHRLKIARLARRAVLEDLLSPTPDAQVLRVLWARGRWGDRAILEELVIDLCTQAAPGARRTVEQAVITCGMYEHWLRQLRKGRVLRRAGAALKLGHIHDARGLQALLEASSDPSAEVRLAVTLSLGRLKAPEGLPGLIRIAQNPPNTIPDLTLAAALASCARECPSRLRGLLGATNVRTRIIAAWALSEVGDGTALPALLAAARDPEPEFRAKVARALARIQGQRSLEALIRLARDRVWFVRVRALDALRNHPSPAAEAAVLLGLDDRVREVRCRAASTLLDMAGPKAEVISRVLAEGSKRGFNTLISVWERAGFLRYVVRGLSPASRLRFAESQEHLRCLISAGFIEALIDYLILYPDIKIRLRLLRLLLANSNVRLRQNLLALAEDPGCDWRVAAAIKREISHGSAAPNVGSRPRPH